MRYNVALKFTRPATFVLAKTILYNASLSSMTTGKPNILWVSKETWPTVRSELATAQIWDVPSFKGAADYTVKLR
jgi:hypothetical protein